MVERFGSGDSYLLRSVIPLFLNEGDESSKEAESSSSSDSVFSFERLRSEVNWSEMINRGGTVPRLISYQAEEEDEEGKKKESIVPIYRLPTDSLLPSAPFTPSVLAMKLIIEEAVGQRFNHCLIQLYRSGNDYIKEHSDKTLDIALNSCIVNLSLGATRQMKLISKPDLKKEKEIERIALPHNSLFVLGWETNREYLHCIAQDRRDPRLKSREELAFGGERISLTFRLIATFERASDGFMFGQGAILKTEEQLEEWLRRRIKEEKEEKEQSEDELLVRNERQQSEELLKAFSLENHSALFDWHSNYGAGFDIRQARLR